MNGWFVLIYAVVVGSVGFWVAFTMSAGRRPRLRDFRRATGVAGARPPSRR